MIRKPPETSAPRLKDKVSSEDPAKTTSLSPPYISEKFTCSSFNIAKREENEEEQGRGEKGRKTVQSRNQELYKFYVAI